MALAIRFSMVIFPKKESRIFIFLKIRDSFFLDGALLL